MSCYFRRSLLAPAKTPHPGGACRLEMGKTRSGGFRRRAAISQVSIWRADLWNRKITDGSG